MFGEWVQTAFYSCPSLSKGRRAHCTIALIPAMSASNGENAKANASIANPATSHQEIAPYSNIN